jgi:quercetin dioxygenase-like cupin family protein
MHSAAAVKWGPGPAFLPAKARFAVLQGDPGKSGVYTIRLRLPAGYVIKSHFHPNEEEVTVLSGTFLVGMGDTLKARGTQRFTAGGFITVPKDAHHYAMSRGVTVLQLHGEGPFEITYVNPADDPRNAQKKP